MAVKVTYDENCKMILEGLECNCPCDHDTPNQDIYVGSGLLEKLPGYIEKRGLGRHCVVVCDENTYKVAGEKVHSILSNAGFDAILLKFVRDEELVPDERTIGELLLTIQPETEFLVAVGSGSITDNNFGGHHCIHFTNSRTHGTNKVCSLHQAAIKKALKYNPDK